MQTSLQIRKCFLLSLIYWCTLKLRKSIGRLTCRHLCSPLAFRTFLCKTRFPLAMFSRRFITHSYVTLLRVRLTIRWMRVSSRRAGYTHHKFPRIGSDKRGDKVVAKRAGAEAVEIPRINLDRSDAGYYGGLWHFLHNVLRGIEQYAVKITNAGDLSWWGECVWACVCLWFMSKLRRSQHFCPLVPAAWSPKSSILSFLDVLKGRMPASLCLRKR